MAEMSDSIDQLNKQKGRAEKEKATMERDLQEQRAALDDAMRERANLDKNTKMMQVRSGRIVRRKVWKGFNRSFIFVSKSCIESQIKLDYFHISSVFFLKI